MMHVLGKIRMALCLSAGNYRAPERREALACALCHAGQESPEGRDGGNHHPHPLPWAII